MGVEVARNEAERWFERYLLEHGYDFEYEPDLDVTTRPDFRIARSGIEIVCEVKGFEQPPPLEKRLTSASTLMALSDKELFGPMRSAVREATKQLKPLADRGVPLVVVLANPKAFYLQLDVDHLMEALFGTMRVGGTFNPETGSVENLAFEYGRDGRLRNYHDYISAVLILRELDLDREAWRDWHLAWKESRPPVGYEVDDILKEVEAAAADWENYKATHEVASGNAYAVDVITTGSAGAAQVPENVFDGPRDRRTDVVRVDPDDTAR